MIISFVNNIYAPLRLPSQFVGEKAEREFTFPELVEFFDERLKWDGPKANNEMFLPARVKSWKDCKKRTNKIGQKPDRFAGCPSRCNENIIAMSALVYDIDNKDGFKVIDPSWFVTEFLKCQVVIASSASSAKAFPRCRVVAPLLREVSPQEYWLIQCVMLRRFAAAHPDYVTDYKTALDEACAKPSQPYYLPQYSDNAFVEAFDGQVFDPDKFLAGMNGQERQQFRKHDAKEDVDAPKVQQNEGTFRRAVERLKYFDPNDEDDRWMLASALCKTFTDPAFAARAEAAWQEWYRASTNWTEVKAAKKWRDAEDSPAIHIGFIYNKLNNAKRRAGEKSFREQLIAGGFKSPQLGNAPIR